RGKADVGDLVELVELVHHHVADLARRHVAHAEREQSLDDALDRGVDVLGGHRALVQREPQAKHELGAAELGAPPVLLDHLRQPQLEGLVGGEALAALRAAATAPDAGALLVHARVDHLGIGRVAEGALHGQPQRERLEAYTGKRRQSLATSALTCVRPRRLPGASSTSAISSPTLRASSSPKPRVVIAGEPSRMPLVTAGFSGSFGIAFLLTVMPTLPSSSSTSLPVSFLGRRSSRNRWQSVPPDTTRQPRSTSTSASARALAMTCFW